ncbi:hypothetical protein ACFYQA_23715 [Streptomyces sp. NPDC005774]|uniref:hypothetical protein n=1 Tax=Streptomyces sp. NPDC005774 TaxID=3364728 RepID=UPI003687AE69
MIEDVMHRSMSARRGAAMSGRRNRDFPEPVSEGAVEQLPYSSGVKKWWRSPGSAFRALDRALGGQQRPDRLHQKVARHPVKFGLCLAVPFTLFFWTVTPEGEPDGFLVAVLGGLLMGSLSSVSWPFWSGFGSVGSGGWGYGTGLERVVPMPRRQRHIGCLRPHRTVGAEVDPERHHRMPTVSASASSRAMTTM